MVGFSKREVLIAPFVAAAGLQGAARAAGNGIGSGADDAPLDLSPGPLGQLRFSPSEATRFPTRRSGARTCSAGRKCRSGVKPLRCG
jgi:hypothetical protein